MKINRFFSMLMSYIAAPVTGVDSDALADERIRSTVPLADACGDVFPSLLSPPKNSISGGFGRV